MLRSMTGYAAASGREGGATVHVTVKSVNHRFLDLHVRLPAELEPMDPKIRRLVRDHLSRGHVDVTVALEREGGVEARIDHALVRAYLLAYNRLREEFGVHADPYLNAALKLPGALAYVPSAPDAAAAARIESLVLSAVSQALEQLDAMRAEEARSITTDLSARAEQVRQSTEQIEQVRGEAGRYYLDRLRERLSELLADNIAPDRLAQEAALLAERSDIAEELLRLKSHVSQFQALLAGRDEGREAGKRLDFLLQEMGRESNTILAKTSGLGEHGIRITNLGLQIKAEIEKLREQVQNLQ